MLDCQHDRQRKEVGTMKKKKKQLMLLECLNENLNAVIVNQERIYCRLAVILKKLDRLEKDSQVIAAADMEEK